MYPLTAALDEAACPLAHAIGALEKALQGIKSVAGNKSSSVIALPNKSRLAMGALRFTEPTPDAGSVNQVLG